jgi:predicted dehydrogenase
MTLSTAVVGVGYLGKFHAEKYTRIDGCNLIAVADPDREAATACAERLGVSAVDDYRELLGEVDAVSIAAPTSLHHAIARDFLTRGTHVLVEKPITVTVAEADELIELATDNACVLQVGHLERFNPALRAADSILAEPMFIESHRLAPFNPRGADVSVVLDLMIHDIDIILNLVGQPLARIDANGVPVISRDIDIANARLQFDNGCVANVTASRVSQKSERKMRLFQPNAYLALDFQSRSLDVRRKASEVPASGIPEILSDQQEFESGDAIMSEIRAFLYSIRDGSRPIVSGEDGRQALATAIEITRQLNAHPLPGQLEEDSKQ